MRKDSADAKALVYFCHHRPHKYEEDMAFFEVAREEGLVTTKVFEQLQDTPMFEDDPGDRDFRRTVFGYELTWPKP